MYLIKTLIDEINFSPPQKIYETNRIVYNHIDEIWSIDLADMVDYKILNNKQFKYIFIIIHNFNNYTRWVPLKNKNSKTKTDEISNNITSSKQIFVELESDRVKERYNSSFQVFLKVKNIYLYSRYTEKGPSIVERVIETIHNLLKQPVFEKGNAYWISDLPSVIKKNNNTIHSSTKMTLIQAFKKSNEKIVYSNLQDRRARQKPNFSLGQSVLTADIKRVFSKTDSTNWSYKLYTITKFIHDTIPSYRIDCLPRKNSQNFLLPTKLSLEENNQVMKKLNLIQ